MSLLQEIQKDLMSGADIAPILLKLRYLAGKLGSQPLADWVKYESEGYPSDADIPDYRGVGISYSGTFSGPFGSGIQNAPIPSYLVEQYAGKAWVDYKIRQGAASLDALIQSSKGTGSLQIDCSNLILILQGKIYEDYALNSVKGNVGAASLSDVQNAVRNRILELTLELEKSAPEAINISLGSSMSVTTASQVVAEKVTQNIIYGNLTHIENSGRIGSLTLSFEKGDHEGLVQALVSAGIPSDDAEEFAALLAQEDATKEKPLGMRALAWFGEKANKVAAGAWGVGLHAGKELLSEVALRYYGFK